MHLLGLCMLIQPVSHVFPSCTIFISQLFRFLVDLRLVLMTRVVLSLVRDGALAAVRFQQKNVLLRKREGVVQASNCINELLRIQGLAEFFHLHEEGAEHLKQVS